MPFLPTGQGRAGYEKITLETPLVNMKCYYFSFLLETRHLFFVDRNLKGIRNQFENVNF